MTMARAAPKPAAEEMPRVKGLARDFEDALHHSSGNGKSDSSNYCQENAVQP